MKPRVRRTVSTESKIGLKKRVATTEAMLHSLKDNLNQQKAVSKIMMNGANKATELFERATTENRVLRNEMQLVKEENNLIRSENDDLKKEVLRGLSKIKDMALAHEHEACDWITEKCALEQELEHERALNLKLEAEMAMKRGKILVLEDEKRILESRGLLGRMFRIGESK